MIKLHGSCEFQHTRSQDVTYIAPFECDKIFEDVIEQTTEKIRINKHIQCNERGESNSLAAFIHKAVRLTSPLCRVCFACDSNWEVMLLPLSQLTRPSLLYSPPLFFWGGGVGDQHGGDETATAGIVWLGLAFIYDTSAALMGWEGDWLATRSTFLSRSVSQ